MISLSSPLLSLACPRSLRKRLVSRVLRSSESAPRGSRGDSGSLATWQAFVFSAVTGEGLSSEISSLAFVAFVEFGTAALLRFISSSSFSCSWSSSPSTSSASTSHAGFPSLLLCVHASWFRASSRPVSPGAPSTSQSRSGRIESMAPTSLRGACTPRSMLQSRERSTPSEACCLKLRIVAPADSTGALAHRSCDSRADHIVHIGLLCKGWRTSSRGLFAMNVLYTTSASCLSCRPVPNLSASRRAPPPTVAVFLFFAFLPSPSSCDEASHRRCEFLSGFGGQLSNSDGYFCTIACALGSETFGIIMSIRMNVLIASSAAPSGNSWLMLHDTLSFGNVRRS
eukprot:scaffold1029_cov364-Pinguiococcus_pyrenoidosus.AAC.5